MPYKVTVKRLDESQVNANSRFIHVVDGQTPKLGELVRVKCGHVVIHAQVEFIVERSSFDWVTASEAA